MEVISFEIIGEPTGKGRPKFSRQGSFVKTYTPEKTANYEQWVKLSYIEKYGNKKLFDDGDAIHVRMKAIYGIPKSVSKKKAQLMMLGKIRPTKKPDCDNIIKIVLDALNGLAYADDAQVVSVEIEKYYVRFERELAKVQVAMASDQDK